MQRLPLLIVFLFCMQFCCGQVQSNCSDNVDLIAKEYGYDIHYLTVEHLRNGNHPDKHLIRVPQIQTDSVLHVLTAIFNTGNKLQADSVFDSYCVHEKYAIHRSVEVRINPSTSWTSNWINRITETGIAPLDNLLKRYNLVVNPDANFIELITDELVNRWALCDSLERFDGILAAYPTGIIKPGISEESIRYSVRNKKQIIDFFLPWQFASYNAYNWKYTISENCSVSLEDTVYFLSIAQTPRPTKTNCNISAKIAKQDLVLYPNPTSGQAIISTAENGIIEIFTLSGQRLKRYISYQGYTPIDLSDLAKGIYIIQHRTMSGKSEIHKIVKE